MRISDWSSDVCSSDLGARGQAQRHAFADRVAAERHIAATLRRRGTAEGRIGVPYRPIGARGESRISPESRHAVAQLLTISAAHAIARRSEEHKSELPSLMRTPYAVFCFKQKTLDTSLNNTKQ